MWTSSINFSNYKIFVGDKIFINELGFSTLGYTIISINGQTLILNANMPLSITNGNYSVNQTSYDITSEINIYPNIAVSTIHTFLTGNDLKTIQNSYTVNSVSTNFNNVLPGYLLRIDAAGFELVYHITQVFSNFLLLDGYAPSTLNGLTFQIYSPTAENELPEFEL